MGTYAIGDIQGCLDPLLRLLDHIEFDPGVDRLWLCGDLVNRGPDSLGVLRFVKGLGSNAFPVIGNHDLHLLARAEGLRPPRKEDTMDELLAAPDRDELLDWLSGRPFVHTGEILGAPSPFDPRSGPRKYLLVHAGLLPEWSLDLAVALAAEATGALRTDRRGFLEQVYSAKPPTKWSEQLVLEERLRMVVAGLVRLRALDARGHMDDDFTGHPSEMPQGHQTWFDARSRIHPDRTTILFGHWAALGLLVREDVVGLDTGCVWGGSLTAFRLEDGAVFQVGRDA